MLFDIPKKLSDVRVVEVMVEGVEGIRVEGARARDGVREEVGGVVVVEFHSHSTW